MEEKVIKQKRAVAIHDVSCFGKCSLTVALPILSAAGIETCPVPTAMLSTHTGGFTNIHIHDLTDDIEPIADHWKSLELGFNSIYTGYLGSFKQLDIVSDVIDKLDNDDMMVVVDPVMADHGKLYGGFSADFPAGMAKLCAKADVITPNFTEAAFLLGEEYVEGPYTKDYVEGLLKRLAGLGAGIVVLTGVYFDDKKLGAAAYNAETGEIVYAMSDWITGAFHGTGDIFTSVLLSALLNDKPLQTAIQTAADFVSRCVERTKRDHPYMTYGVNFEAELPSLMKELGL